jgi:hypothetical protein
MGCGLSGRSRAVTGLSRLVLAFSLSMLAVGCPAASPPQLRPEAEVTAIPLSTWVNAETLRNLAAFAAKDRHCLSVDRRARSARQPPEATLHGRPYGEYTHCMYSRAATACDATADDLRTLRTLLNRDPRLEAIESFDTLLAKLTQECGNNDARSAQLRGWNDSQLQHCDDQHQPVLITQAILLRSEPPGDLDQRALWASKCGGTPGSYFLDEHCRNLQRRNVILARKLLTTPQQVAEQGVEAYFCPRAYELLPPDKGQEK